MYRERSFLYCSTAHPLFDIAEDRLDLDALARHDFVMPGYTQSPQVRELYRPLHAAATAYQMEGLATLVLSGRYIGFLPDHYAEVWIGNREMRPLLAQRMHFVTEFAAIRRKGAGSHPVLDAFVEEMTRAYR
ncbi:substrate-binding domain-containing protein [Marinobacterium aestuariivivens]|uniref:Substrate-binding domain-containing protein n=1 Tax=Marinobacterium aestuariivivens TaxID=1698799 RepID=A0ABW1ZVP0_9GAMM